jgi:hypothetical protein
MRPDPNTGLATTVMTIGPPPRTTPPPSPPVPFLNIPSGNNGNINSPSGLIPPPPPPPDTSRLPSNAPNPPTSTSPLGALVSSVTGLITGVASYAGLVPSSPTPPQSMQSSPTIQPLPKVPTPPQSMQSSPITQTPARVPPPEPSINSPENLVELKGTTEEMRVFIDILPAFRTWLYKKDKNLFKERLPRITAYDYEWKKSPNKPKSIFKKDRELMYEFAKTDEGQKSIQKAARINIPTVIQSDPPISSPPPIIQNEPIISPMTEAGNERRRQIEELRRGKRKEEIQQRFAPESRRRWEYDNDWNFSVSGVINRQSITSSSPKIPTPLPVITAPLPIIPSPPPRPRPPKSSVTYIDDSSLPSTFMRTESLDLKSIADEIYNNQRKRRRSMGPGLGVNPPTGKRRRVNEEEVPIENKGYIRGFIDGLTNIFTPSKSPYQPITGKKRGVEEMKEGLPSGVSPPGKVFIENESDDD